MRKVAVCSIVAPDGFFSGRGWPAETSRRRCGLAAMLGILACWEERSRLRWELERMSRDNPHLIDDIGLTARQVEAEIAKPFWRA